MLKGWNICVLLVQRDLADQIYYLIILSNILDATCLLKCSEPACLNLCRRTYSCECYDYANGYICKHLHALHMLNNQQHNSRNDKPIMLNEEWEQS